MGVDVFPFTIPLIHNLNGHKNAANVNYSFILQFVINALQIYPFHQTKYIEIENLNTFTTYRQCSMNVTGQIRPILPLKSL